jgi:hypothetical protein
LIAFPFEKERSAMTQPAIDNLGIPPLAGICTYESGANPGYSVETSVNLLRRYNYLKTQLNLILAAHLPRTPEWEVKCALSLHLWLDAEHAATIRARVAEMREPPLGLDKVPDARLETWLNEVIRAENTVELLIGAYRVARTELIRTLERHLAQTNPLADYPTRRVLRHMLLEEKETLDWGEAALEALDPNGTSAAWETHLRAYLTAAGGLEGNAEVPSVSLPTPRADGRSYDMGSEVRRDARFRDNFNASALIDVYYNDPALSSEERIYALLYKRLREMDVPEWMAPIIFNTKGKPFQYYLDLSRQLWDECRHAMMGEVGLARDGIPFYRYPLDLKSSASLNANFSPLDAHVVLWGIEQSLMARETGKQYEWTIARDGRDDLAATYQDYDWADEVLHAQIGRRWLQSEFADTATMHQYAQEVITRWLEDTKTFAQFSDQKPWWQDFLREARSSRAALERAARNVPEPQALAADD